MTCQSKPASWGFQLPAAQPLCASLRLGLARLGLDTMVTMCRALFNLLHTGVLGEAGNATV